MIKYTGYKDFLPSMQKLMQQGGESQRRGQKAFELWVRAQSGKHDPFQGVPLTNNGESRIKHCIKYDLGGAYRLITIQNKNICLFCYAGNHDQCDSWLTKNKGITIAKDKNNCFEIIIKSVDFKDPDLRPTPDPDFVHGILINRLEKSDHKRFMALVPLQYQSVIFYDLIQLNALSTDRQISELALNIDDVEIASFVYDVLIQLRAGDLNQALASIDLKEGLSHLLDNLSEEEILEIEDGMTVKKIIIGSDEYREWFRQFINSSGYQDWMLFMHPAQQKIVNADFEGSAKLSGVSGSGKTCIVVNRAIRLAKEIIDKPILVLTLNKSLAALIQELLNYACPDEVLRGRIIAKSFCNYSAPCSFTFINAGHVP